MQVRNYATSKKKQMKAAKPGLKFIWRKVVPKGNIETKDRFGARPVLIGHKIYFFGGRRQRTSGGTGDILDTNLNQWTRIGTITEINLRLCTHSATLVDDKVLLLGPLKPVGHVDIMPGLFQFDPLSSFISGVACRGEIPEWTIDHSAEFYEEGRIVFVLGGISQYLPLRLSDSLRALHVDDMRWELLAPKGQRPPKLYRACSCIVQHTLFVVGGRTLSQNHNVRTFVPCDVLYLLPLRVSLSGYCWHQVQTRGSVPKPMGGAAMARLGDGRNVFFGGHEARGSTNKLYVLETRIPSSPTNLLTPFRMKSHRR